MKKTALKIHPLLTMPCSFLFLTLLVLIGSAFQSLAQFPQGSYTNNFATGGAVTPFAGSGSVASWIYWYNTPGGNLPITNDVTRPDPNGGPGAGSLEVQTAFTNTNATQDVIFGTFDNLYGYDFTTEINLANFSTLSFDIYVGTNNTPNTDGNFGTISAGVVTSVPNPPNNNNDTYEGFSAGTVTIPAAASNGWVHLSVPVDNTIANITFVGAIAFDINSYNGYPTNTFTFWLGNVVLAYSAAPPPPPTVSLAKVKPGLTQFADVPPTYNRQDLRTDQSGTANISWYNRGNPVTYSWTIASYPSSANPNFLVGLNLTPDVASGEIFSDPDWSDTNDIWVALQNNADGTVTAGIAYKTNQPAGNGQLFSAPTQMVPYNNEAAGLTVPSAIGTWSVTFNNNTSVTLTAPNGSSTNVTLPANVAALFNGYVGAYLYSTPGNTANLGQYVTFSSYKITGVGTPVNEDLAKGGLASPFLQTISQNYFYTGNYTNHPPDQIFATSTNVYWLYWTLPDAGFSPVASSTLLNPLWIPVNENVFQNGSGRWAMLSKSDLPGANIGFFALIKRTAYQLQVLMPGETNAPNTLTGKVGTPIAQSASAPDPTTVTINMCDAQWNIVNSSDTVHLISSDSLATLPSTDAALINGTVTEPMFFGSAPATNTVTASDVTTPAILSNMSSPVTVDP